MNTPRKHKYAILLAALLCMTLLESFSQRLLRPVVSDFVTMTTMLLVLIVPPKDGRIAWWHSFRWSPPAQRLLPTLGRTHRRTEQRQPRLTDERWFHCSSGGPTAGRCVGSPRSAVRSVLHSGRGCSTGWRKAAQASSGPSQRP